MDSDYFFPSVSPAIMNTTILGVIILFLFFISGILSAGKTSFSLLLSKKDKFNKYDNVTEHIILYLMNHPGLMFFTFSFTRTFLNVAIAILFIHFSNHLFDFPKENTTLLFILEITILSLLFLIFTEIIPKKYAGRHFLKIARKSAPVVNALTYLCKPLFNLSIKLEKVTDKKSGPDQNDLSVEDISKVLELASEEIPEKKNIFAGILRLSDVTAIEIMTPRLDVSDINIKSNFREVIDHIIESGYSRIPVYSKSPDNIQGILYSKDLLPYLEKPTNFHWQSLIRPAYFVPETKKINDLFDEFKINKVHFAVVIDEFGGTSGIITLEDILEEIVGEIDDEYDKINYKYIKLQDNSYIFEAKIQLIDFFRITGLEIKDFGKLTEEVETLGGLILELKGDFPLKKEILEYNNCVFQVLEVDKRRIVKVKLTIKKSPATNEK